MNLEQINKCISAAMDLIDLAAEEMKREIDWNDAESVDFSYRLQETGGRLLKIRHEINKKYKED